MTLLFQWKSHNYPQDISPWNYWREYTNRLQQLGFISAQLPDETYGIADCGLFVKLITIEGGFNISIQFNCLHGQELCFAVKLG